MQQATCYKGDFVDDTWRCNGGSRKEVSIGWTGDTVENFTFYWDGMAVDAWHVLSIIVCHVE